MNKKIKDQEVKSVNAMKVIQKKIEDETNESLKHIEEQIEKKINQRIKNKNPDIGALEKQYEKKIKDLKDEKDEILNDMIKLQSESTISQEKSGFN